MSTALQNYFILMRFNKPIGLFLLLWPTLWALWLASPNGPSITITLIFITGVILMRSAGCIINDIADRNFDHQVKRTTTRPITSGAISIKAALILFSLLIFCAFLLLLTLNSLCFGYAWAALAVTIIYPFCKRFTHLPQAVLGIAFAWGVPMAFAAMENHVPAKAWTLFAGASIWPLIYDTMYAMVDRDDDILIGVKSSAILFGNLDRFFIACLQILFFNLFVVIGFCFHLGLLYYLTLPVVAILFIYQQKLIFARERSACLKAFINNHWVGLVIFIGILLGR